MAAIVEREIKSGKRYDVMYDYYSKGKRGQKTKTFERKKDAEVFKLDIERKKLTESFITPSNMTVKEFMEEYVESCSANNWGHSHYTGVTGHIEKHINPFFGEMKLQDVTPKDIDRWLVEMRTKKVQHGKGSVKNLKSTTIRSIFYSVKIAFELAVEWRYIEKSPVVCKAPKRSKSKYTIWSAPMFVKALEDIDHEQLHLAVHLSFICSLRVGEAMGITLDKIDLKNKQIHINKSLARAYKDSIDASPKEEILYEFPPLVETSKSRLILSTPKTDFSDRIVYLSDTLVEEIKQRIELMQKLKSFYFGEYTDYNLLFSHDNGQPIDPRRCSKWFEKWQNRTSLDFPRLKFHEIRHSSSTYKLSKAGSDIKSVQGDTGHSEAKTLLDTYGHIQEDNRKALSQMIANEFFSSSENYKTDAFDEVIGQIKQNPDLQKKLIAALLS